MQRGCLACLSAAAWCTESAEEHMCTRDAHLQLMGLELSITPSKRPTDPTISDMLSFLLNEVIISFMFYFTCSKLKQQNKFYNNKVSAKSHFDVTNTGWDMLLMRLVANFHNSRTSPQDFTLTFVKELTAAVLEKKPETHCKGHKQSLSEKVPKFPNTCRHIAFSWQWMSMRQCHWLELYMHSRRICFFMGRCVKPLTALITGGSRSLKASQNRNPSWKAWQLSTHALAHSVLLLLIHFQYWPWALLLPSLLLCQANQAHPKGKENKRWS